MPSFNILDIKSVRFKNFHIDPSTGHSRDLGSINKAKKESKTLGGASSVRAFSDKVKAYDFLADWKLAEKAVRIANLQREREGLLEQLRGTLTDEERLMRTKRCVEIESLLESL